MEHQTRSELKDPKTSYAIFCAWTMYALDLVLCLDYFFLIDEAYVWTMLDVECVGPYVCMDVE